MDDITRLSYWFPKLQEAGLPVPKTHIIKATKKELDSIIESFETKLSEGVIPLAERIAKAALDVGYPAFLRTDHFSGKHDWERMCFIENPDHIAEHVVSIAYMWECVNMFALPCDVWAVREFLPTIPHGVCKNYGNMPICKEFRFFVEDGNILCFYPYWPEKALINGKAVYNSANFDYEAFCTVDNLDELKNLASMAGKAVGGKWSIDILETTNGWYVTDMAEAHKSYHWEDCELRR